MRKHPQFLAFLALAAVCFFWGTTYLGIRMALESFPPPVLVCIRYLISGTILLIAAFLSKAHLPSGRELLLTSLYGIVIIGVGNGCLAYAEEWIPSSLAALFLTTSPFWMVGVEALLPGGEPLHGPSIAGMLVGLLGTALLVSGSALGHHLGGPVLMGFLLLQVGCCAWAFGSIAQRRHSTTAHPVVSGAVQQLAAGLVYLVPSLTIRTHPIHWSARGVGALIYLVIFGSIVGYSAYVFALDRLPVSVLSIYTYVNPAVAVLLGWLIYREPFGLREAFAMLIIFLGVAIVKRVSRKPQPQALPEAA